MPPFFWTQKQDIGPSSRTNHGLVYDGARQRVLLFGGDPGGPPLADTWNWDGALWTQVADTGPSARQGLAMAFDAARKRTVLFGGASGPALPADTWTWDGTEWTQVSDTGPPARSGHAMAYDSARARVVLFGGRTAGNPLGDTWVWDGTEWTQVQDVGPSARRAHAMAFDPTASRMVLFGGAGATGAGLDDTWLWDGADWTQAADTGPDPRAASAMVAATTIVLFGGVNSIDPGFPSANRIIYGDSWRWDGNAWTKVQDIGPAPRWGHGMAFRSDASRIVLVGGSSVFGPSEDASLKPGVMRDTWEHPEAAAEPEPGGGGSQGVEVATVAVNPNSVTNIGDVIDVTVTLTKPASAGGVALFAYVLFDQGAYNYRMQDPSGFTFPQSITVAAGGTVAQFQMVRDGQPLASRNYILSVVAEGGNVVESASFAIN
jgi:hypothetical protein